MSNADQQPWNFRDPGRWVSGFGEAIRWEDHSWWFYAHTGPGVCFGPFPSLRATIQAANVWKDNPESLLSGFKEG